MYLTFTFPLIPLLDWSLLSPMPLTMKGSVCDYLERDWWNCKLIWLCFMRDRIAEERDVRRGEIFGRLGRRVRPQFVEQLLLQFDEYWETRREDLLIVEVVYLVLSTPRKGWESEGTLL